MWGSCGGHVTPHATTCGVTGVMWGSHGGQYGVVLGVLYACHTGGSRGRLRACSSWSLAAEARHCSPNSICIGCSALTPAGALRTGE
eukprot:2050185-Prymnesium_polylepis.1